MISGKQIHFNIDFEKTTPLYCEFLRGDSIEFHFDFNNTYNATKMRVLCYTKHGQYAFGDEFTDLNVATFYTNRTAGYSGLATITVQLLDDSENLINSANIVCKIIESNTQTPFIVSPDFAEKSKVEIAQLVSEGKLQIVKATSDAKEEIDNWSDQNSRFAKNESDISDLQLFKANTGALHFNGGSLVVGASGTTDKMPSTFSWCRTLNITQQQWSNVANGRHFDTNSSSSAKGLSVFKTSNRLGFKYGDGTFASGNILLSEDETNVIIDGKTHTLVIVGANERLRIYVDNILLRDVSVVGATTIPSTSYRYQIDRFTGKYSRIYNFNFDITSEDAPYTLADYQQGKPIPPKAFYGQDSFVGGIEQSYSWLRSGLTMTSNITFNKNGTNFIFDNTNGTILEYQEAIFNVNIPKGAYLTAEGVWSGIYYVMAYNKSTNINIGQIIAKGNKITPLTLSADCNALRIRPMATEAGSTKTITLPPSCKIKVNGAILALEDYTITNGTTQMIFDYSGNNNDATVTGTVKGDNDNRIAKLIDFIKA